MNSIVEEILNSLPEEAKTGEICYEASDIVVYTKSYDFLLNCGELIRQLVNRFKKRIEVRASRELLSDENEAENKIRELAPKEAEITEIYLPR